MQSLLFCQNEKSASVLIPLVQGLDIVVKHEREVFSAMRSLMAERFDFLIFDYEDEQTARLFLEKVRSSPLNKAALAVAVVAPETSTNAFRAGADFLVTKPINPGPAGGVLRIVRASVLRSQGLSSAESATKATTGKADQLPKEATHSPQKPEPAVSSLAAGPSLGTGVVAANTIAAKAEQKAVCQLEARAAESLQPKIDESSALIRDLDIASPPAPADREVGKKTVKGINKTPPLPFIVLLAIVGVILVIVSAIDLHIHSKRSSHDNSGPVQSSPTASVAQANTSPSQSNAGATAAAPLQATPEPQAESSGATAAALPIVPGQLDINSTPGGGQVQVDAKNNSASVARRPRTGLAPRRHSVTTSKPQYLRGTRTRTIKVATGGQLSVGAELAPLTATVSLNSDPDNAAVWIDGRDTGRMTPAQISVDKPGDHTFVFKKQGYLDETTTANLQIGQRFLLAPSLRVLGRTDEIKMVGGFRKLFGGEKAGMGIVSVNTQPKGAQIAVNTHIMNKPSPAKFYLNPGNYVIDITLPGLNSIHRVVSVGQRSKVVIDEVMAHE
jgi:PEGA domain